MRAVWYYRHGLDRLAGKWVGRGPTGDRFADPNHLYAADLDLFGDGSLFQRVSAARTAGGENMLAGWLLAPATAEEVRAARKPWPTSATGSTCASTSRWSAARSRKPPT